MSTRGHFIVSTTDADDNRFEAKAFELEVALIRLARDVEVNGLSFTLERIDVRYESPVATVRIPDEALVAVGLLPLPVGAEEPPRGADHNLVPHPEEFARPPIRSHAFTEGAARDHCGWTDPRAPRTAMSACGQHRDRHTLT